MKFLDTHSCQFHTKEKFDVRMRNDIMLAMEWFGTICASCNYVFDGSESVDNACCPATVSVFVSMSAMSSGDCFCVRLDVGILCFSIRFVVSRL